MIKIYTKDPLDGPNVKITADGFVSGNVEVATENLEVNASGFVSLSLYGQAKKADMELDGFGRINAKGLDAKRVDKSANGFASIRVRK